EPNWDKFVRSNRTRYSLSADALALLNAAPQQQISTGHGKRARREIEFDEDEYELQAVTILLRVARNNVFHGGKLGATGWDDVNLTLQILTHGKNVLDELAEFGRFNEYTRRRSDRRREVAFTPECPPCRTAATIHRRAAMSMPGV